MTIQDRIAITPEFSALEGNERAEFYFENRDLIETWAALRADANRAIEERLPELADYLSDDLAELGVDDPVVQLDSHRSVTSIHLSQARWDQHGLGSPIRVVVESGDKSIIGSRGSLHLYSGLRVKKSHPETPGYLDAFAGLANLRNALDGTWKQSQPTWPLWRYVEPTHVDWALDGLLQDTRADVLRLWSVAAPKIGEILT